MTAIIDFDYYEERLSDKTLLKRAIGITLKGGNGLYRVVMCVPVDSRKYRRTGSVCINDLREANFVISILQKHPRWFPDLRIIPGRDNDYPPNVEWGERLPEIDMIKASEKEWIEYERTCGRMFGYSLNAIKRNERLNVEVPS